MRQPEILLLLSIVLAMAAFSCSSPSESSSGPAMAVIQKKIPLKDLPSASGIEKVGDRFYVIGDDSPYLFCLDQNYAITQKILLLQNAPLTNGRIAKPVKPDFESITTLLIDEQPYLLILGSGSTDKRNTAFLLSIAGDQPGQPMEIPLEGLFSKLAADQKVIGQATLNIEGLAADEEYIYLLQRFSPRGQNVLITYSVDAMAPFLSGDGPAPTPLATTQWGLPAIKNIATGFSGATAALGGRLLFTASAEETPDAVLDGEVYGSMVGWLRAHQKDGPQPFAPTVTVPVTEQDGTLYKGKIESISFLSESRNSLKAVAVTDNDDGFSELIEIHFTW